ILFGIILILSLKYIIPFFSSEHKIKVKRFSSSFLTSFVFGIAFAIGWTPCVGAILGAIYTLALTSPGLGFLLLLTYSLGIGIPFLIVGAFTSKLLVVFNYIGLLSVFLLGTSGAVSSSGQLNFLIALIAGILTFLSPCILPLLPAFFSYMAGTTAEEVRR
ncbi:MAG: hypothetical protein KGH57_04860, partial [Candidatus Micrarchaeota archaeon]|nr:hypothetical protein [Candidatus Micrarchaeota archaeon]